MIGKLDYLHETPSQTAGPYVHIGLIPHQAGFDIFEKPFGNVIAGREHARASASASKAGCWMALGAPCRDVLVEIWQANAAGRYNHPADQQTDKPLDPDFRGWGRAGTDFDTGVYPVRNHQARPGHRPARLQADGAAHQYLARRARHQHRPRHPHVFRGRDRR